MPADSLTTLEAALAAKHAASFSSFQAQKPFSGRCCDSLRLLLIFDCSLVRDLLLEPLRQRQDGPRYTAFGQARHRYFREGSDRRHS
jgi:hypothetical protein